MNAYILQYLTFDIYLDHYISTLTSQTINKNNVNLIQIYRFHSAYFFHQVSCHDKGGAVLELQNEREEKWLDLHSHIRGTMGYVLLREVVNRMHICKDQLLK